MEQRVKQFIERERLLEPGARVLVALSGGADSVALLRVLHRAGYACEAAHCNFHLRGAESDRDEAFVRGLCAELGVRLHTVDFDTTGYAAAHRVSIEMAARELRYEWFERVRLESGADVVAVAHHQDDSVETVLLNLIRGTGIAGLLGIRPRNGRIVRPLLCVDREAILRYLQDIGQTYVTDSTNLEDAFTRNKIRLHLLPLMQSINPSVKDSIQETSRYLGDVFAIYNRYMEEAKERMMTAEGIRIADVLSEPAPEAFLFEVLHPLGFNSDQIGAVFRSLGGQPGKVFCSREWRVVKDRDYLLVEPLPAADAACEPPFRLVSEEHAYTPDFVIPRDKSVACFDADKLDEPLTCRPWQTGDVFVPFGMRGRKKVSDYLTDRKFSLSRKEQQWVMCCGNRIAWLIGERTDNRFRVDEHTRRVVVYKMV